MANELTISIGLNYTQSGLSHNRNITDLTTAGTAGAIYSCGTVSFADTAAGVLWTLPTTHTKVGYVLVRNLDAAYYVEFGVQVSGSFWPFVKLRTGEIAVFPISDDATHPTVMYGRGQSGHTVTVDYTLIESV